MNRPEPPESPDLGRSIPQPPDPASIMLIATALIGLGVTMIYSGSSDVVGLRPDQMSAGAPHPLLRMLKEPGLRQLYFVPPALGLMWLTSHLPYSMWRLRKRWYLSGALWFLLLTIVLLVGVLKFGVVRNGARRWFPLGPSSLGFYLQPSELGKLALVIALAAILADKRFDPRRFLRGLVPLMILTALVVGPVVKEDFGTAFLIAIVAGCMLLAGGARIWQFLMFLPPAAAAAAFVILTSPYRRGRVLMWLAGNSDVQGKGYQIYQSLITIASGEIYGRGLGEGIQKFEYLPADTTDFIFAVVCEELGLIGAFVVIGLFVMLLWQLRRAMVAATDLFGQMLVFGVMLVIGFQAAMNIAVVTAAAPAKGIALPFVSAGGSGLIIMSVALGLAASVARKAKREQEAD